MERRNDIDREIIELREVLQCVAVKQPDRVPSDALKSEIPAPDPSRDDSGGPQKPAVTRACWAEQTP